MIMNQFNYKNALSWLLLLVVSFLAAPRASAEDKKAESDSAAAWWNPAFMIRKHFTFNTGSEGADILGPIGGAPVLVRLHEGNFQFMAAQPDASDIRFVSDDGKTVYPHRIEKFDSLLNEAYVWVALPELKSAGNTGFWLYYGTGGAEATAGVKEAGAELYGPETALVYHFSDNGAPPADATRNANNATTAGENSAGALIGGGMRLGGAARVTIPASDSLNWASGGPLTWSAWVKPNVLQPNAVIFARSEAGKAFVIGMDNGAPFVLVAGGGAPVRSAAGEAVAVGTWAHLSVVAEGGQVTLYLNGAEYAKVGAELPALSSAITLGGDSADPSVVGLVGEIDEMQIAKAARTSGFLKFAAVGQGAGINQLISAGDDETKAGGAAHDSGHNYFGIIFKSLTIDGWVVIWILVAMSAISWWVMIGKVGYLNSVAKGNSLFLRAWRDVAADLTVLDHGDTDNVQSLGGLVQQKDRRALRSSSVYRIYHIGSEEIRHRLARARRRGPALTTTSIEAIRASLDGGLVREGSRLSSGIVLLTIAISGGPFLGLLGTVVGVMITFAAVAAAGDVNVNAIAPGIAAALLATVAGLAVAIPAMFGYNYLLTRIKTVNNDMHVFIDEFITRMAEFYGDDHEDREESGQWPVTNGQGGAPNPTATAAASSERSPQFAKLH